MYSPSISSVRNVFLQVILKDEVLLVVQDQPKLSAQYKNAKNLRLVRPINTTCLIVTPRYQSPIAASTFMHGRKQSMPAQNVDIKVTLMSLQKVSKATVEEDVSIRPYATRGWSKQFKHVNQ